MRARDAPPMTRPGRPRRPQNASVDKINAQVSKYAGPYPLWEALKK